MKWNVKRIVMHTLLILSLLTTGTYMVPVKAASVGMLNDETEIKEVIQQYYTLRYEELQTLTPVDYSGLVDEKNAVAINWQKIEKDRFDVQYKIAKTFEDYILEASFSLNYLSIDISGNAAVVNLIENNEMVYSSNPKDPSKMGGLQHKITLVRAGNGWVIQNDHYIDDLTFVLNQLSMSEIFQNIETNHKTIMNNEKETVSPSISSTDLQNSDEILTWHRYSYFAAVNYSNRYYNAAGNIPVTVPKISGWNASWPMQYKVYSSDCANFVSQAIYQGARYTNSDGKVFYPDAENYDSGWYYKFSYPVDGSSPWINVGGLYTYLLRDHSDDTTRGPAGSEVGICDARLKKGNPILMKLGDAWAHVGIVATNTADCNITVNAHSTNYYHKPISYYSAYTWYPVNISGYYR